MLEVLSSSFHFLQFPWENTKLCASTKSGAGGSGGGLIPSAECQHMAVLTWSYLSVPQPGSRESGCVKGWSH